jgi:hypothetical protein
MTWVAVAVGGAAVVGAGASMYAGDKAAGANRSATNASIAEQQRQYNQSRADFAPQRSIGNSAMDQLARLYGFAPPSQAAATEAAGADVQVGDASLPPGTTLVSTDGGKNRYYDVMLNGQVIGSLSPGGSAGRFNPASGVDINMLRAQRAPPVAGGTGAGAGTPDMSAFFESPDYQFNLAEGQKAIDRSLVAQGRGLSGAGVRQGVRYASGVASQQYGDFTNRLLTIAGLGSAATSNTVAAGQNMANNNSAALINAGNQRASIYGQTAAGVNNSVQGGISNYMLAQYLKQPTTGKV